MFPKGRGGCKFFITDVTLMKLAGCFPGMVFHMVTETKLFSNAISFLIIVHQYSNLWKFEFRNNGCIDERKHMS